MREKKSPLELEWEKLEKQEQLYLQKRMQKKDSKLNELLAKKVPPNLQGTLNAALTKAFYLIFEKGTGVIEKTYKREELEKSYQINEFAASVRGNRKSLKAFSRKASGAGAVNFLMSGVSGISLGLLGIGIPDIVLLIGMLLKSVYEIALNFGFDYEKEEERKFILLLIQGALSYEPELSQINEEVNYFIDNGSYQKEFCLNQCIDDAAGCLSKELLYMKFLQGVPVIGAVGGAYDAIYIKRVVKYAEMKYRRRFYTRQYLKKEVPGEPQ